jgi:ribosome-binding protein aMBF1 (putative translation factor)
MFTHQDWTPVVIRKKWTEEEARREGKTETVKRPAAQQISRKFEKDLMTDPTAEAPPQASLPRLSVEDRQKMIQARVALKLSQIQLAQALNLRTNIIQEMESGKVVSQPNALTMVNRKLALKMRWAP